jgi:4-amino-4-deoxy-L-arabinose transferase-like glycosyltransferase
MPSNENAKSFPHIDPIWAGIVAFVWVCAGIGSIGVTIDEPLDVAPGRHYWQKSFSLGSEAFSAQGVREIYGGNPDHPPLARWVIGAFSLGLEPVRLVIQGNADFTGSNIWGARISSAAAFGLTVAMLGRFVGKRHGMVAGWSTAVSYAFLPHVFGHAHLAALETVLNLTWTAAMIAWIRWSERPTASRAFLAGFLTGLACLTKLQGWLILPWVTLLIVVKPTSWKLRLKAIVGTITAPVWWFVGWPWMWYETSHRLKAYFLSSVERTHLNVLYFGEVYADDQLPWHYGIVQWIAAIPPVVLVMALAGAWFTWMRPGRTAERLLSLIPLGLLTLFSLPVARYDMDRLFLVQWTAVAVLAGVGAGAVWESISARSFSPWLARTIFAAFAILLAVPCLKPSPLSYVSPLAGGIRGFERWGMDLNYWGDAVDPELLRQLETEITPGMRVAVVPTLAMGQAVFLTPAPLLRKGITFEDQSQWRKVDRIVVYRRPAYWPEGLETWIRSKRPIAVRERDGVWLAAIWCGPEGTCDEP